MERVHGWGRRSSRGESADLGRRRASAEGGERGAGAEKERGRQASPPRTRPRAAAQSPSPPPSGSRAERPGGGVGPGALPARGGRGVCCGHPEGVSERGSPGGGTGTRGPGSWSLRPPGGASRNPARVPRASPGNIGDSFETPSQERREHEQCGRGGPERRSRSRGERPDSYGRKRALKRPGQFPGRAHGGRTSIRWSRGIQQGRVGWGAWTPIFAFLSQRGGSGQKFPCPRSL